MAASYDGGDPYEYKDYDEGFTVSSRTLLSPDFVDALHHAKSPEEIVRDATTGFYFNTNTQKMRRGYKVVKLNELAKELQLPSSKGTKTKDYLELVINEVENKGYRFVQFLQLVDVLYVIVQKVPAKIRNQTLPPQEFRPEEEIRRHYEQDPDPTGYGDPVLDQQLSESVAPPEERDPVTEEPEEMADIKSRDHLKKEMDKPKLPWQK